ncbi:MAG TPA: hypothetical protein VJT49_10575 [Amycolatopsis sp.]|uniref:hypothetical protein n=1 Tax=Amycolatopsis sp. TaxID=37632 RepID=UPI002B4906B7|nr:hypothetical protein [Amycolatopsis sp.]HKS45539.1 hypothetical protein [Amycolatopsis sp.]
MSAPVLTYEDMKIIFECAAMPDKNAALDRLTEAFQPRGMLTLKAAAEAAEKLREYDQPVDLGNGEFAMRTRDAFGAPAPDDRAVRVVE